MKLGKSKFFTGLIPIGYGSACPLGISRKSLLLLVMLVSVGFNAGAAGLKDPTRPAYYSAGDSSFIQQLKQGYKLSSVIVGDKRKTAVINGQRVKEGERVGNALVRGIEPAGVSLEVQGTRFRIALSENNFKSRQK